MAGSTAISKDDLVAQALAEVLERAAAPPANLAAYAERYLSPSHRNNAAGGYPPTRRRTRENDSGPRTSDRASQPRRSRRRRVAQTAHCNGQLGAMILVRMGDESELSDEVLRGASLARYPGAEKAKAQGTKYAS